MKMRDAFNQRVIELTDRELNLTRGFYYTRGFRFALREIKHRVGPRMNEGVYLIYLRMVRAVNN